jgi:uncharacterized protein YggE
VPGPFRRNVRSCSQSGFGPDNKFLGYQCIASFALRFGNLDDVQQLLTDIVAAGANEIEAVHPYHHKPAMLPAA